MMARLQNGVSADELRPAADLLLKQTVAAAMPVRRRRRIALESLITRSTGAGRTGTSSQRLTAAWARPATDGGSVTLLR